LIENDWIDTDFILSHADGFEAYKDQVMQRSITRPKFAYLLKKFI
jgi:ferredoxin-nitrate reductase